MDVLFVKVFIEFSLLRHTIDHVYHKLSLFSFLLYFGNMTVIIGHSNKSEPDVLILGHGNISLVHFSSEYQHIRIIFSKICDHTFHVRKLSTLLLFGKNVIISQKSNQSYHLSFLKKLCV